MLYELFPVFRPLLAILFFLNNMLTKLPVCGNHYFVQTRIGIGSALIHNFASLIIKTFIININHCLSINYIIDFPAEF